MSWQDRRAEYLDRAGRLDQLRAEQREPKPAWTVLTGRIERRYEVEEPIEDREFSGTGSIPYGGVL